MIFKGKNHCVKIIEMMNKDPLLKERNEVRTLDFLSTGLSEDGHNLDHKHE